MEKCKISYIKIIREEIENYLNFDDKKIKAVIFDFDFTLVDTSCFIPIEKYAKIHKNWDIYDEYIPQTKVYSGIKDLINQLYKDGILVFVVTNNKKDVAKKTLDYHGIKYNAISGAQLSIPKSYRINKLLRKANISPDNVISVGDLPIDAEQSNAAGIRFIGCTWGNNRVNGINNPLDLLKIIDEY